MKKGYGYRLIVALVFGLMVAVGSGQTWTETAYAITSPPQMHDEPRNSFGVVANQSYQWWVQERSHFVVTGSATQSPPWRMLFEYLCDNAWWYSEGFDFTPSVAGTVTNRAIFSTRVGVNSFSGINPTATASRDLDEKVVEDLYYVFDPHNADPPGGGGN